jgi:hypothetical protein
MPIMTSSVRAHPSSRGAATATALLLLLGACIPVPGDGWVADAVSDGSGADVAEAPEADVGPDARSEESCSDPRTGVLLAEELAIDRPEGTPSPQDVPSVRWIDPDSVLVLALGEGFEGHTPDEPAICARRVIIVDGDDPALRAAAGARAVIEGVPLVVARSSDQRRSDELIAALLRLGVEEVVSYGPLPPRLTASVPGARYVVGAEADPLALAVALALALAGGEGAVRDDGPDHEVVPTIVLVSGSDQASQADIVASASRGAIPLVLPGDEELVAHLVREALALEDGPRVAWAASTRDQERVLLGLPGVSDLPRWTPSEGPGAAREVWLGDVREPDAVLLAAVAAAARGAAFVAVDGSDLRSGDGRTRRIRGATAHPDGPVVVVLVGEVAEHTAWQLDTVVTGTPLPGGGFLPLEDRRIVALYGSPDAPSLGLLGEQDDVATIERAREVAARYEGAVDGRRVVPGLDIIATIASSAAEPTGDYSRRVPVGRLRRLVDLAAEAEMAVFLDLQPGRTSFLVQAQEYEELLREPHVHLALDPEWRLGPGERHLVRIGSVGAEEVQQVADWLAALVRAERLPQKVLMLHQFTLAMLPDRDDIAIPPELVGVVHVDGQGRLVTKDRTYAVLSGGSEERWSWGWKNFTRIDAPVATPEQSLDRSPVPVVVTYQ